MRLRPQCDPLGTSFPARRARATGGAAAAHALATCVLATCALAACGSSQSPAAAFGSARPSLPH